MHRSGSPHTSGTGHYEQGNSTGHSFCTGTHLLCQRLHTRRRKPGHHQPDRRTGSIRFLPYFYALYFCHRPQRARRRWRRTEGEGTAGMEISPIYYRRTGRINFWRTVFRGRCQRYCPCIRCQRLHHRTYTGGRRYLLARTGNFRHGGLEKESGHCHWKCHRQQPVQCILCTRM